MQLSDYKQTLNVQTFSDKVSKMIKDLEVILSLDIINGPDLKIAEYIINMLLTEDNQEDNYGIYTIKKSFYKHFESLDLYYNVYNGNIFSPNINVILKTEERKDFLLREFSNGLEINNLSYIIPTFMQTLGLFNYNEKTFLMFAKLKGKTVLKQLNRTMSFKKWLVVFFHILLSLEIAQENIEFTHFDLHPGNVIIEDYDKYVEYNVPIGNYEFSYKGKIIPKIIDFGFSTTHVNGKRFGNFKSKVYGILPCVVSGFDMYRYLIENIAYVKNINSLYSNILGIFEFYGDDDPYSIFENEENILIARKEFCLKVTYSKAATYTPFMMIKWLCSNEKYKKIIFKHFSISKRKITENLSFPVFQYISSKTIDECLNNTKSFIINSYILHILNLYLSKKYVKLYNLKVFTDKNKSTLITNDLKILNKFVTIELPEQKELSDMRKNILDIILPETLVKGQLKNYRKMINNFQNFKDFVKYEKLLKCYFDFYYIIRQLKIKEFYDWMDKFKISDQYKFYTQNLNKNTRTLRWLITLEEFVKII